MPVWTEAAITAITAHCKRRREKWGNTYPVLSTSLPDTRLVPVVLPFLLTEAFKCHSQHSGRAVGPGGRGRKSPGLSCATPVLASACQCTFIAKPPVLSRLRESLHLTDPFQLIKTRLNNPARTVSGLVEPLLGSTSHFQTDSGPHSSSGAMRGVVVMDLLTGGLGKHFLLQLSLGVGEGQEQPFMGGFQFFGLNACGPRRSHA